MEQPSRTVGLGATIFDRALLRREAKNRVINSELSAPLLALRVFCKRSHNAFASEAQNK